LNEFSYRSADVSVKEASSASSKVHPESR